MHFHFFFSPHTTLSIHSANLEVIRPLDALSSSLFNAFPPFCLLLSASFPSLALAVARYAFGQAREKLHDTSRQADESLMTIWVKPGRDCPNGSQSSEHNAFPPDGRDKEQKVGKHRILPQATLHE